MVQLKSINTERLVMRPITLDEWTNYHDHIVEADEVFLQYGEEPSEEVLDILKKPIEGILYYSLLEKETGTMLGLIGIYEPNANLEYYTFPEHRNHGYCTEALTAFREAFLDGSMTGTPHEKIVAEIMKENAASRRVLEKTGFEKKAMGIRLMMDDSQADIDNIEGLLSYEYVKPKTHPTSQKTNSPFAKANGADIMREKNCCRRNKNGQG